MITTLIFDLDGLLADTEKLHCKAYQDALAKYGFQLTEQDYGEHWILKGGSIREFIDARDLKIDPELVRIAKAEFYEELVKSVAEPMPGALSLLSRTSKWKKLALATSSYEDAAHAVLKALNIGSYFACIATRSSVARIKPFPDLFLYVGRELGETPENCLVLEDSEKGVIAASAAGMKCIAVPNIHTIDHDFSMATVVVPSLDKVTRELIENI
ncbi:MAG: HAD family hydrolase [Syntrophorhabdus sp.]